MIWAGRSQGERSGRPYGSDDMILMLEAAAVEATVIPRGFRGGSAYPLWTRQPRWPSRDHWGLSTHALDLGRL